MGHSHPALTDFRNFLYLVWHFLNLPDPTDVQYDIASYLQHGPRRLIIEAFRGVGKSWITAAFVVWLLLRDPQLKIMVVSASKERADAFSIFVKRLIADLPMAQHLKPGKGQRDSSISFDVGPARNDQSPSVKSVGITGQLTGSRADIIIADDIETPKNSLTQVQRDRLAELVKEFDAVLKPNGRIMYLGTPQTEMSLYNRLPERGYEMRIWPARIPLLESLRGYKDRLAPYITNLIKAGALAWSLVDPKRFNEMDMLERETSYGRSGYALQFMLDTSLSDANKYPLRLSDLVVMDLSNDIAPVQLAWAGDPKLSWGDEVPVVGLEGDRLYKPLFISEEWTKYSGSIMAIDPSGRGADETGVAIVKQLSGYLWVLECTGVAGGYSPEALQEMADLAKKYNVNEVIIESNFGDGMFTELFKPVLRKVHKAKVSEVRHSTQKEHRIIDTLEPIMNQHRLVVDRRLFVDDAEAERDYQLFYQMTRLTRERGALGHDDRLESLAIAVNRWIEVMSQDTEVAEEKRKEKLLDKELKKFMRSVIGRPRRRR